MSATQDVFPHIPDEHAELSLLEKVWQHRRGALGLALGNNTSGNR